MHRKLLLIVNPAAGRGAYKKDFADGLKLLDDGGCRTTVIFTGHRGIRPDRLPGRRRHPQRGDVRSHAAEGSSPSGLYPPGDHQ